MQALSKFSYRYPLNWVQDFIELPEQSIFSWWSAEKFQNSVFKIGGDSRMAPQILTKPSFDLFDVYTIMVGNDDLYGFKQNCKPATFTLYKNISELDGKAMEARTLAEPLTGRSRPSLVNFVD